jgi:general stress protein 26
MSTWTQKEIAEKLADIDFAMLSTRSADGNIAARPMSNNGDVEYDGDNFFFAFENTHVVEDVKRDSKVGVSFTGSKGLLGRPPVFISIEATAELIRDREMFKKHWVSDMDRWAKDGVNTPGLVLIKAHANRIHYWDGEDSGEVSTPN